MKNYKKTFLLLIPLIILAVSLYYFIESGSSITASNSELSISDSIKNDEKDKSLSGFKESRENRQYLNQRIETYLKEFPSPTEVLFKLKAEKLVFNKNLINDVSRFDSYLFVSDVTAVNLGVYTSDIAYLSAYDQLQDVIKCLNVCRQMSDHLGVTSAFDIEIIEEFKKNFGDKKRIEALINKTIKSTTDILRTDERTQTAILLLAGAYIEGLHISTNIINPQYAAGVGDLEMVEILRKQGQNMDEIISLLKQLESNERVDSLLLDFENLKVAYQNTLDNEKNNAIDPSSLMAFAVEVNKTRNKIVLQ
ncbi:MAG: hypothetical protein OEU76_02880 [Cyclobacteriaceae bacterium]|nr:hypothetical protein [Cyclobacteriaceae bacterium]